MNMIKLVSADLEAEIDPQGAWLTSLVSRGEPILYPRTTLALPDGSSKVRGGCHVCVPNFGPGGASGQPQHGFARESAWTVDEVQPTRASLSIAGGSNYSGLTATLAYVLDDRSLRTELTVSNQATTALRISPGFHPYFHCSSDGVLINGEVVDRDQLDPALVLSETPTCLQTQRYCLTLKASGLAAWVGWSDGLDEYVCVEPTMKAFSFLKEPDTDELLQPAQTKTFSLDITLV